MVQRVGNSGRTSDLMTPGSVYFMQAGDNGRIKIGWSSNVAKRVMMLQTASPEILTVLHSEPGTGRDERDLHSKFGRFRVVGEWFLPAPEILAYIETRKLAPPKAYQPAVVTRPSPPSPRFTEEYWAQKRRYAQLPPEYWDYGNPGWDQLVEAAKCLQLGKGD